MLHCRSEPSVAKRPRTSSRREPKEWPCARWLATGGVRRVEVALITRRWSERLALFVCVFEGRSDKAIGISSLSYQVTMW